MFKSHVKVQRVHHILGKCLMGPAANPQPSIWEILHQGKNAAKMTGQSYGDAEGVSAFRHADMMSCGTKYNSVVR